MARRLTSCLLLTAAAVGAVAQPFGRYGYTPTTSVPGFQLEKEGFRVNTPGADLFRYEEPTTLWKPVSLSSAGVEASLSSQGLAPRRIQTSSLAAGFSLFFESGFRFHLRSTQAPFLTWADGSVGPDVPTPPIPWVIVSFKEQQPPILLSFPNGNCSVIVKGSSAQWTLSSTDTERHLLRVTAPLGLQPHETTTAAQLGELLNKVRSNLDVWTGLPPTLKDFHVKSEPESVTVTWKFDRAGALLPFAARFAVLGGYGLTTLSPLRETGAFTEAGAVIACATNELTIRLPVARASDFGRLLEESAPVVTADPAANAPLADVVSAAFAVLHASSTIATRTEANEFGGKYIAVAPQFLEPYTGQNLPFDSSGKGMDRLAAAALVVESSARSQGLAGNNPMLLSLLDRCDFDTLLLECPDEDMKRRSSAIAAVAFALSGEDSMRMQGAMLEAGLAAERGFNLWASHRNAAPPQQFLEVLEPLRAALFYGAPTIPRDPFAVVLASPMRVLCDFSVQATQSGQVLTLSWMNTDETPKHLVLAFPCGAITAGHNVAKVTTTAKPASAGRGVPLTAVEAEPVDVGISSIKITLLPGYSLPPFVAPAPYSEARR